MGLASRFLERSGPWVTGRSEPCAEFAADGDRDGDGGEPEDERAAVAAEVPVEREVADGGDHSEQHPHEW